MSQYRAQTELALNALAVFTQFARQRSNDQCQVALAELRIGALTHMVDALVTRRVDVVKESFALMLGHYAEYARHFMTQQQRYADAELDATDPFKRVELRARIQKIDTELALIRIDAQLLYARMTEVLLMLGGSVTHFADDLMQPLALPAPV